MPLMNFWGMIFTSHDVRKLSKKIFVCTSRGEGITLQEIFGMAVAAVGAVIVQTKVNTVHSK